MRLETFKLLNKKEIPLEKKADAYEYQALAQARGEAEQLKQEAEGYKARVINEATGEASQVYSYIQ